MDGVTAEAWTRAQVERHADDAVTHEHDLREAVGRPGAQDSAAVEIAVAWLGRSFRLPPDASDRIRSSRAPAFTVMRAMSGRMSIAAMDEACLPGLEIAGALAGSPLVPPTDGSSGRAARRRR